MKHMLYTVHTIIYSASIKIYKATYVNTPCMVFNNVSFLIPGLAL